MRGRYTLAALMLALVIGTSGLMLAQNRGVSGVGVPVAEAERGDYWLLVVGIDAYKSWPTLRTARKDSETVKQTLLDQYAGFDRRRTLELYDREATRERMIGKLRELAEGVGEADSVLIYYAGHGHLDKLTNSGYWVPADARGDKVGMMADLVSNEEIKKIIGAMKSRHILLVSDSCFAGDFFRSNTLPEASEIDDKYVRRSYERFSRQAITSGGLEPVTDSGFRGHSVFSHFLLDELKKPRSYFVASALLDPIRSGVMNNSDQTPRLGVLHGSGAQDGEFVFFRKYSPPPPQPQRVAYVAPAYTAPAYIAPAPVTPPAPTPPRPGDMVLIPAGTFTMGSNDGDADEKPPHKVTLDAFWIDRTEVTVEEYRKAAREGNRSTYHLTGYEWPGRPGLAAQPFTESEYCNWDKSDRARHPMNCVDWNQAKAYCEWAGKRLPTEAEWERAARGTEGRKYPWGDEEATCDRAVMEGNGGYGCGEKRTWPVCGKPAGNTAEGICDMAGNVWEWVADGYDEGYYGRSPSRNPKGAENSDLRVFRGGGWGSDAWALRSAYRSRYSPGFRGDGLGFRCAVGAAVPGR